MSVRLGYWIEIYRRRHLLRLMIWKDLRVRYSHTVFGVAWAIAQPVANALLGSALLGTWSGQGFSWRFFAFSYSGFIVWIFFARVLGSAAGCLTHERELLKQIAFPRVLLPLSIIVSGALDLTLQLMVLLTALVLFGGPMFWTRMLMLPLFAFGLIAASSGVACLLSALDLRYRDLRYAIPFLSQAWFLASPVLYASRQLRPGLAEASGLNPLVAPIAGLRWALLGETLPVSSALALSLAAALALLALGLLVFRRTEAVLGEWL